LDAYLEWEKRLIESLTVITTQNIKKVKLIVIEFTNYALIWWDQLVLSKKRNDERPIESWDEMKVIIRKLCIPNFYYRELFQKL